MLAVRPHRAPALNRSTRKGFTLLELIVVLLILGILAAIAIPTFNLIQENSVKGSLTTTAEAIVRNANAIATSSMTGGADVQQADLEVAVDEAFGTPAPVSGVNGFSTTAVSGGDAPTVVITLASGNIECDLTIAKVDPATDGKIAITVPAAC